MSNKGCPMCCRLWKPLFPWLVLPAPAGTCACATLEAEVVLRVWLDSSGETSRDMFLTVMTAPVTPMRFRRWLLERTCKVGEEEGTG